MNKYQISILVIALSCLSWIFPIKIFAIMAVPILAILLVLVGKSIKREPKEYDPYLFLTLTALSILIGIFISYNIGFALVNSLFFTLSCIYSLKAASSNKITPVIRIESEHVQTENKSEKKDRDSSFVYEPVDVSNGEGTSTKYYYPDVTSRGTGADIIKETTSGMSYDGLIDVMRTEISKQVEFQLGSFSNQIKEQFDTTKQFAVGQEKFMEEVKGSLIDELSKTMEQVMEKQYNQDHSSLEKVKEEIKSQLEGELQIDSIKGLMFDLQTTMSQQGKSVDYVKKQVEDLNKNNPSQSNKEIYEEIIRRLQEEKISFTNNRHLVNQEIKDKFYYALKNAQEEVCIMSPWLGNWILSDRNELMSLFEALLSSGVRLKIAYGISNHSYYNENTKNQMTDKVAAKLSKSFKRYGDLFQIQKVNSHQKLLICDQQFYIQGSYNLLSNQGKFENPTMWDEGAEYSEDPIMLNSLKKLYFDFN